MPVEGLDGLTQFGLMGKISTGYSGLDVLLCLCLPALLQCVTRLLNDRLFVDGFNWRGVLRVSGRKCERRVLHEKMHTWWSSDGCDGVHNHLLQRAILFYINSLQSVTQQFEDGNLLLHEPVTGDDGPSFYDDSDYGDSGDGGGGDDEEICDTAKRLQSYSVIASPPKNQWVTISKHSNGDLLEFMRDESKDDSGGDRNSSPAKTTIEFVIRAKSRGDPERLVQEFVDRAFDFYKEKARKRGSSKVRYLYSPYTAARSGRSTGEEADSGGSGSGLQLYKCYPLSEAKTFDNGFFHPDKRAIMSLIDHFRNGTGKFAISGYPRKLGLLLHGPPGTGKTSLIKALAQYTGRHIVSVPLNRVETNQELMDIMFDREYRVVGQDLPVKLPFSKTIFVMEDVDAACNVVQRRDDADKGGGARGSPCSGSATSLSCEGIPTVEKKGSSLMKGWELEKDKLNLAGLLNVLDGVLDCPDRIVVMTTNHPEKLDPALIRPGRVNKKVYMGYLQPEQALQMVAHYFGEVSADQETVLRRVISSGETTPATLEMLCGEHDTVAELCTAMQCPDDDNARGGSALEGHATTSPYANINTLVGSSLLNAAKGPLPQVVPTRAFSSPILDCGIARNRAAPAS